MTLNKAIPIYFILSLLALTALFPLLYVMTNSFIGAAEFNRYYDNLAQGLSVYNPLHLIPEWITLEGYREVFISRPDFLMRFWWSLFLSGSILAGQLVVGIFGGYAFARFRFPGRNIIFFMIILLMMLPLQVTLVPNHIVLDRLGLIGSYSAIIMPAVFSAFGVFLMRQIMITLPDSIFEAARLDGAGAWKALWQIALPNCKPGLAALAIMSIADSWSMVEQPLIFLRDQNKFPLSVFLLQVNKMQPSVAFVCSVLSILPALLLFLKYKDEMVAGIEYAVVKQ